MQELRGLARGWDQIVPPPRHHRGRDPEHAIGNRVAMMMVVEQPPVEFGVLQGGLDSIEIHAVAPSLSASYQLSAISFRHSVLGHQLHRLFAFQFLTKTLGSGSLLPGPH